ncbi:MAG TPA: histidine kinase [Agriterribacter sp.]|nr:histidine kinase [Chitinophagaceae bacterium]HRP32259.1 histidine kinase [Agriterribacter sp.]
MPASVFSIKRNHYYFAIFWISWSIVHIWILQDRGYGFKAACIDSVVSNALLAGISLLVITTMRHYLPRKESVTYLFLLCIGLGLVWFGCAKLALSYVADEFVINSFNESVAVRVAIAIPVFGCVILMSALRYTLEEQKEQERRNGESERLVRDAELYKLRQQLQPHFLFNSLNSISALIISRPDEAREMIQQLSDYLRNTLRKEEHLWVKLGEEIHYLELYLSIEKVRFGHRLSTVIQCGDAACEMKLPAMLLQPIVENAIKFGLYDTTENITISIECFAGDRLLTVTVKNPFDPEVTFPKKGTGFGLNSVRKRLFLLFARNDLLSVSTDEHIFITQVKIPQ